jgi:hypothetical protein
MFHCGPALLKTLTSYYLFHSLSYIRLIAWQGQLVKELGRAEALSAEVMQLSAQLEQVKQAYDGLARL